LKLIKKVIIFALLILIVCTGFIIYKGYKMYDNAITEIDLETKVVEIRSGKDYVYFENLPEYYVKAVVAVEDNRFYNHKGIDIISLGRAIINNIKSKKIVEGGSTITQQLAKNMYFTQEKKFSRKIAELFLVYDLEKNYTKEDIFELYVNISYFGDGYYGIGEAARGYLKKEPKDMTLLESTLLAGIPNAPSVYAPTKNPDLAIERQKQVISSMVTVGDLTQEEAENVYSKLE